MPDKVTLLTPSYRRDLERLLFLRESLEACQIELPHVVVVPDAQLGHFSELRRHPGVTLCAMSEVLPPPLVGRLG